MADQNELRRKALMDQLGGDDAPDPMGGPALGAAPGIAAGEGSPNAGPAPVLDQPMPSAPAAPVRDFSRLAGYDEGKFNANKDDAKYQIGGVLSGFDPRQGINGDVLGALNKLGYGTFSGQGDKLSLSGITDLGRQKNLQGDYNGADFIQGFKSGNGKWGYADPVEEAKQAQAQPQGGMGVPLDGALTGNPLDAIQQALAQMSGSRPNFDALLAQLGAQ